MSYSDERVRIIYHPDYSLYYATASCEIPDRVISIMKEFQERFTVIKPEPCSEEDILLCHSMGLLHMEKSNSMRYEVARLSAGGAIEAAKTAMEGYLSFAVIRPPGHHANPDHNWGFCFFNNMGIALSRLKADGLIRKSIVLDIDLHYGDGTEEIFKNDDTVEVINIQASVPDAFISQTQDYLAETESADIIGISAGFDQYIKDWGANLSTDNYREIGVMSGSFARKKTGGKIFLLLEGGYYIPDLGKNALALLEGIMEGLF